MPFQYTNRRGNVYHLQSKPGRGGAERYSFTRKLTGTPVEQLPEGHEVRELPDNGQVVLRKIKPSDILPQEKQLAEAALRNQAKLEHFIVEADGNELVIWLPDTELGESLTEFASTFGGPWGLQRVRESFIRTARYSKMMRFVLADADQRTFDAQRWCFRGSIDGWYFLDGGKPLAALLKRYVRHLGNESFYELM
jgi:hypothetical protein